MQYIKRIYRGRINRRYYALGLLFVIFLTILVSSLVGVIGSIIPGRYPTISMIIFLFLVATIIVHVFSLHVRRLHDLGIGAKWLFLSIIPGIGLIFLCYLLFAKGNKDINKYGEAVPENSKFFHTFFNDRLGK